MVEAHSSKDSALESPEALQSALSAIDGELLSAEIQRAIKLWSQQHSLWSCGELDEHPGTMAVFVADILQGRRGAPSPVV